MRTTFNAMFRQAAAGVERAAGQLAAFQRQVSSGRRIEKPSDDPSGMATAIGEHAVLQAVERYSRTTSLVSSRLGTIDTVLSDMIGQLTVASTAALAASGTPVSEAQRQAAALQLASVRDTLFDDLNMKSRGAYVFGGANATTAPFQKDASGTVLPYAGSTTEVQVDIGPNRSVTVAFDGSRVIDAGGGETVFTVLDDLIAAAHGGDSAALSGGLKKLEAAMQNITAVQSRIGTALTTLDEQQLRLARMKLAAGARLDRVEAADMVEALSRLTHAEAAYEAALRAVSATTRVSLMDYLR